MSYKKTQLRKERRRKRTQGFLAMPLVLLVLLLSMGIAAAGEKKDWPNEASAFGINLGGVTYWSTEIVFVDLFKHSQTWKSQAPGKRYGRGGTLDLTKDGWVRSLADNRRFSDSIILSSIKDRYPRGGYTCHY